MAIKLEPVSDQPAEEQLAWLTVLELLQSDEYEDVAELLHEAQQISERTGKVALAHILAAAHQICLACSQCRTEVRWHQQAYEDVNRREHELKQALEAILDVVGDCEASSIPENQAALHTLLSTKLNLPELEDRKRFGILQRLQNLLEWGGRSQPSEPEEPAAAIVVTVAPPTETLAREAVTAPEKIESPDVSPGKPEKYEEPALPSLMVYCLGQFRAYLYDQLIETWSSRKSQAIFKYLVAHCHPPVSKDILMDTFWPEADPESARRNLHQAIYALRQTLKTEGVDLQPVQFENDCYQLNPDLKLWLDYEEFEKHVHAGQQFEQDKAVPKAMAEYGLAEGLYQGDFMAEDLYEEWLQPRRQYLQQTYFSIAHRLAQYYLSRSEHAATIALSQRVLSMDSCQEEAHQILMKCYLAQRQRHLAIRQYQLCLQTLKAELDLPPSEETCALYQQIARG